MGKMCMLVACGHPETLGWSPNRYVRPGSVCDTLNQGGWFRTYRFGSLQSTAEAQYCMEQPYLHSFEALRAHRGSKTIRFRPRRKWTKSLMDFNLNSRTLAYPKVSVGRSQCIWLGRSLGLCKICGLECVEVPKDAPAKSYSSPKEAQNTNL